MTPRLARTVFAALLAVGTASACTQGATADNSTKSSAAKSVKTRDSAAGSVDLRGTPYKPAPLAAVGSISGTITLEGGARKDSVPITVDQDFCGRSAEGPVTATAQGLSNSVVWIADMKTGKAHPVMKRSDLASDECAVTPRVQAAVVGTTFNVTNGDKLLHKLIFTPLGSTDTLTVMPFFNAGQVVASERLAKKSGIVSVICAMHPWTHAYIAVFDHPYFAVTAADGAFRIDSVPPGTYKLMVWHEGAAQPLERQVQVAANSATKLDVALTLAPH